MYSGISQLSYNITTLYCGFLLPDMHQQYNSDDSLAQY